MNYPGEPEDDGKPGPAPATGDEEAPVPKNIVISIRHVMNSIEIDKIHEMKLQYALVQKIKNAKTLMQPT